MLINKRTFIVSGLIALAMAGFTGAANAATSTQSASFPPGYPPTLATVGPGFTYPLAFNSFDSSLGTLTSVTYTLSTTVDATVTVFNSLGSDQPFTNATATIPVTVTNTLTASSLTTTATAGPFAGVAPVGQSNAGTGTGITASNSGNDNANLAAYVGTGSQTVNFTATAPNGSYTGSAAPGVFFSGTANAGGTFTLTYTYTPNTTAAPEPGSVAMAGMGLFGMLGGAAIRRRKRTA